MSMYNLLEYSQNYSMTSESLWNCCRIEIDDALDGKSFNYRTKIVGKPPQRPDRPSQPDPDQDGNQPTQRPQPLVPVLNNEVTIPLKYHSNFWRFLDLPLIDCEIELDLSWANDCQNIIIT